MDPNLIAKKASFIAIQAELIECLDLVSVWPYELWYPRVAMKSSGIVLTTSPILFDLRVSFEMLPSAPNDLRVMKIDVNNYHIWPQGGRGGVGVSTHHDVG